MACSVLVCLSLLVLVAAQPSPSSSVPSSPPPSPLSTTTFPYSLWSRGITASDVAVSSSSLNCTGQVLKGGRHFPWESTCQVRLTLTLTPPSSDPPAIALSLLTLHYSVKVPRHFNWSSEDLSSPSWSLSPTVGQVAAKEGRLTPTWVLLNTTAFTCQAALPLVISDYDDAAWFPEHLKLKGALRVWCEALDALGAPLPPGRYYALNQSLAAVTLSPASRPLLALGVVVLALVAAL